MIILFCGVFGCLSLWLPFITIWSSAGGETHNVVCFWVQAAVGFEMMLMSCCIIKCKWLKPLPLYLILFESTIALVLNSIGLARREADWQDMRALPVILEHLLPGLLLGSAVAAIVYFAWRGIRIRKKRKPKKEEHV